MSVLRGVLCLQGSVIMTVLTYLLGGGNSFSSGGPGKGMHRCGGRARLHGPRRI